MHRGTRVRLTLFLTVMAWLVVLPPAHAYIDPGSTSVILQAVVAGIAAIGTGMAVFWSRITSFFRRGSSSSDADSTSEQV